MNFQIFNQDLEKSEEPEIKLLTSVRSSKKQESSIKTFTSASLTMPKSLIVWITTNSGKFLERWECQTTWPASWEICMQVKKQKNWMWNNRLIPNWERSMSRLYIVSLLIYLKCSIHHVKCRVGSSTNGIKITEKDINNHRYTDVITLNGRNQRRNKEYLDESERGEWKVGLRLNIQKLRWWHLVPSLHGK